MTAWWILSTPPLPGRENMDMDLRAMEAIAAGEQPPTLRFFRWAEKTVSFGRLQRLENVRPLAPRHWAIVQRPTGGGIVFHDKDLCFSLCWPHGLAPLPSKPTAQYEWIHRIVCEALAPLDALRMAESDAQNNREPFAQRQCFTQPVGFDLLHGDQKIVGGALARKKGVTLYQGAIQSLSPDDAEPLLAAAFQSQLSPARAGVK